MKNVITKLFAVCLEQPLRVDKATFSHTLNKLLMLLVISKETALIDHKIFPLCTSMINFDAAVGKTVIH